MSGHDRFDDSLLRVGDRHLPHRTWAASLTDCRHAKKVSPYAFLRNTELGSSAKRRARLCERRRRQAGKPRHVGCAEHGDHLHLFACDPAQGRVAAFVVVTVATRTGLTVSSLGCPFLQ